MTRDTDGKNKSTTASRRDFLQATGGTITWGMLAGIFGAALPAGVNAQDAARTRCINVLYQNGDGVNFDYDYYRDHHLVTIMKLFGHAIERFELRKTIAAPGGPAPAYLTAVNIWISDMEAFAAAGQQHNQTLIDDIKNFTNAQATIQNDDVYGEMGDPRSAPKLGQTCLTILYPNSPDVRWDVGYYTTGHMPLIMRLYGPEAISRFELRKGVSAADGTSPAPQIGCINIYINKQEAFDAAGREHTQTLVDDVPNFSSVNPVAFPTEIIGIG
ncbi:MAG: EthD family reductase [Gammaproteobacteria bacterium]|nr:EthD family reductase [Gammaproteobacteria bacterium]